MRAIATLLLVLLCFPARADDGGVPDGGPRGFDVPGEPKAVDVERAVLTVTGTDGGIVLVHGGCWLSTDTCLGAGRREVAVHTEARELAHNITANEVLLVAGLIAGAFLTGLAVEHLRHAISPPVQP